MPLRRTSFTTLAALRLGLGSGASSLGKAADQITASYYPGTARASRANTLVRVLLQGNAGADTLVWGNCGWPSGVQVTLSDWVG